MATAVLASCSLPGGGPRPPALTVVIVVDQMRADYLDRFGHLFEGGFARLLDEGFVYTDAHQDHAITVTAVGHATIATGVFPARHGIVNNDFVDRTEGRVVYSASDPDAPLLGLPEAPGRSPVRLRSEGMADWLKAAHPDARVFSVSLKDRSAVMMGGKAPDGAYWYHEDAPGFVTSSYYASSVPDWIEEFEAPQRIAAYFGRGWERALPEEAYTEVSRDDWSEIEGGGGPFAFPYRFDEMFPEGTSEAPGAAFYDAFRYTPFADAVLFEFAQAAIENEDLGADDVPDLLMIGASAGDYIGHRWGPYSHELQDYYIRLDGYLGELFDFLDERVGEERWALILSSDHGVAPAPEETVERGRPARRISTAEYGSTIRPALLESMEEIGLDPPPVVRWEGGAYLVTDEHDEADLTPLREAIAGRLEDAEFFAGAFTLHEIGAADVMGRDAIHAFRRSYDPERTPDVVPQLKPYYIVGSTTATHGSAYTYDTHVPLIFKASGLESGAEDDFTRTVDIAPTVARWLDITVPKGLDGRVLGAGKR